MRARENLGRIRTGVRVTKAMYRPGREGSVQDDLGVVPLSAPPPSVVVLDTSAVVCALLGGQPQHDEWSPCPSRTSS